MSQRTALALAGPSTLSQMCITGLFTRQQDRSALPRSHVSLTMELLCFVFNYQYFKMEILKGDFHIGLYPWLLEKSIKIRPLLPPCVSTR